MKTAPLLAALLLVAASVGLAAEYKDGPRHPITTLAPLPPGLTLPVTLKASLQAGRTAVGTPVKAVTTQRLLLPGDLYLKAGAHLMGSVIASSLSPATLSLSFTSLRFGKQTVPIRVRAIAAANFTDVSDTSIPASGSTDRANSNPANWTTPQVGGDEVARSGWSGEVINAATQTVGFADYHGVYALPRAAGETPHAMGVFSTTAHGLYGKAPDCTLDPASPAVTIICSHSRPELHSGDNLLLEVTGAAPHNP